MKFFGTGLFAAGLVAFLTVAGPAEANRDNAKGLCAFLDQLNAFASKCKVSNNQKAVDVRLGVTAQAAAAACPELVKEWKPFDMDADWSLRILPPGNSRQPLAACRF